MVTFDYECKDCQYKFEKSQSIKAAPITKCPKCGQETVKRLITFQGGVIIQSDKPIHKRYQRGTLRKHRAELNQKWKEENKK